MGVIVKITCKSCKSEWQCRKGCGILHGQLENVKPLFPQEVRSALERYESGTKFPFFDFGYELACCEHCKSVESLAVIRLPELQTEYTGVCEECGQKTERIDHPEDARCPVCGEYALIEEETGLWD